MRPIACIGAGVVGCSWAVVFARAGYSVRLWDDDPEATSRGRDRIDAILDDLASGGAIADPVAAGRLVGTVATLDEALDDAIYVQESVSERLEIKRSLFASMDRLASEDAILASSTSAIAGSQFMTGLAGSRRCIVAHPVNPPHLIPLVEICATSETAAETSDRTAALLESVGQKPIRLRREIDGFILNRLQWALLSEAMHLVGEGYCGPEDVDAVMTHGLALRWAHRGPLAVVHLNADRGLQGYFTGLQEAIARVQATLRTEYVPSEAVIAAAHAAMERTMPVAALPRHQADRNRDILKLRALLGMDSDGSADP